MEYILSKLKVSKSGSKKNYMFPVTETILTERVKFVPTTEKYCKAQQWNK